MGPQKKYGDNGVKRFFYKSFWFSFVVFTLLISSFSNAQTHAFITVSEGATLVVVGDTGKKEIFTSEELSKVSVPTKKERKKEKLPEKVFEKKDSKLITKLKKDFEKSKKVSTRKIFSNTTRSANSFSNFNANNWGAIPIGHHDEANVPCLNFYFLQILSFYPKELYNLKIFERSLLEYNFLYSVRPPPIS